MRQSRARAAGLRKTSIEGVGLGCTRIRTLRQNGDDQMIARIWHGAVPLAKSEVYLDRMRKVALPDYKSISGNRGAYCLHRVEGDVAHFDMLTFWEDIDAIKRFAGDDYKLAKYYDFDRSFLIELEPYVRHFTMYDG
jgi:heme-degrading monooxygenase HmoA